MKQIRIAIKYFSLLLSIISVFSSKAYSQDTTYVDQLIDSAHAYENRDFEYSLKLVSKAYKIANDSNYLLRQVDALNLLGYLYYVNFNKYDSAYYFIYKAYDLSELNNYRKGICEYYLLKGVASIYFGNLTQAKIFISKSLQISEEIDNKNLLANSQLAMGRILAVEGLFMVSLNYIDKAIENYKAINDMFGIADTYFIKGAVLIASNDDESAIEWIYKAKSGFADLGDSVNVLQCEYQEAVICQNQKKYKEAIPIFIRCSENKSKIRLANEIKYFSKKNLSDIYGELKQFDKAYILQKEYLGYMDSTYSISQFHKINNIQSEYENAIKEKEKQALQKENEINSLRIKKKKIVNWLAFFILIQALIFAVIIYRKYKVIKKTSEELHYQQQLIHDQEKEIERRRNAKIKQNLEYKKRELAVKVFQIFQGSQLTQQLLAKLQSLRLKIKTKGRLGEEIRDDIQTMINEIKFNTNVQIWDEFEMYFNRVTPGFKSWLSNAYPNLTANEIRLCIFSQLNLKTKEISNITLQSPKSINVARTRLRKKLGVEDQNTSVSSFLLGNFTEYKEQKELVKQ